MRLAVLTICICGTSHFGRLFLFAKNGHQKPGAAPPQDTDRYQGIGGASLIDAYERKAHHFANYDVLLVDKEGAELAQLRHWTIFKIATVEEQAKLTI